MVNLKTGVSTKQSTSYFLPPDTHMHVCVSGGKKCSLFGKIGVLCFLETPVLRFTLLAITDDISDKKMQTNNFNL